MNHPKDLLLARLHDVREVAPDRWRARCPAHDGRNRNVLSIGATSDGTMLVKCFHGCTALEVVSAVGLGLADLFPRFEAGTHAAVNRRLPKTRFGGSDHTHLATIRHPRTDWAALVGACERDLLLVKIILSSIARGEAVSVVDATACDEAAARVYRLIQEARLG